VPEICLLCEILLGILDHIFVIDPIIEIFITPDMRVGEVGVFEPVLFAQISVDRSKSISQNTQKRYKHL
jgi:hypothetical protein